jgi:small GTP-binding protein
MLHGILDGTRKELLADVRRQLGDLRVAFVRAGAGDEEQKALARSITQLDELFLLVVVGEFNAGKSAVINALVGERVLEEGVTPTTSRIELLRHGQERSRTPSGGGYVEITRSVPILREMCIVDTPGTNAVVREHEALTRDFVPRADLVLFVTSADRPFTESERAFLETIRDWGKKVVVAVNKTDILDRPGDVEKVVDFVRSNLRELLGLRPEVFAVSARRAQRARSQAGDAQPQATAMRPLETYLTRTLNEAERVRIKLSSPVGVALSVLDRVGASARDRLAVVEADDAALREIDGRIVLHVQEQSREFRFHVAEGDRRLADLEKRAASFLERTLRLARAPALFDGNVVTEAFRREVMAGLPTEVAKQAEAVIDSVVGGEARLWPEVADRLGRRRVAHGEPAGAGARAHAVNRARPLEAVQRDCRRALDGYDAEAEGRRLSGAARWAALGTLLLPLAGLATAGIALARTDTASGVVTGVAVGAALVAAGLLPVPALLRREKGRLADSVEALRQRLEAALRAAFERELQATQKRVRDATAPFAAQVRAEGERIRALSAEVDGRRRELAALRARIEAMQ